MTDLRVSDADFFTRDLDEAVRNGDVDAAVHSAKDVPYPVAEGLDWVWLPWTEDRRDVLILPRGKSVLDLPPAPRIGVSSERREAYCRQRFPNGEQLNIRGNIEHRIEQLDAGDYDLIVMAAAALVRLGLEARITEWISLEHLPAPEAQGTLCMTFRAGSPVMTRVRSVFIKAAQFVGAGAGDADWCTVAGVKALKQCDVCLHDALLPPELLTQIPPGAKRVPVGKRAGSHSVPQEQTTQWIADEVRKGRRVVRLKGGDPGIFGRLTEETQALETLRLPYRVIPAISSLAAATTATGMLLTQRGTSRGFCVMTPRRRGGGLAPISGDARGKLPIAFFMATQVLQEIADELIHDGTPRDTPSAVVFDAGSTEQQIVQAPLAEINSQIPEGNPSPGLLLVGEPAAHVFCTDAGALQNQRVLLTCSEALQQRSASLVRDFGGVPVPFPLVELSPVPDAAERIEELAGYDWVAIPSPSAARCLLATLRATATDLRVLPPILACGPATCAELAKAGVYAEATPDTAFGTSGMAETGSLTIQSGQRVLRVCSDVAPKELTEKLRQRGAIVDQVVLYNNTNIEHSRLPVFDTVFFASGSAVRSFVEQWGVTALDGKTLLAIGAPTATVMQTCGISTPIIVANSATADAAITTLAGNCVRKALPTAEETS